MNFGVRVINEYYFKIIFKRFDSVKNNLRSPIERGSSHPITNYNDAPDACHLFLFHLGSFFPFAVPRRIQLSIKYRNSDKTNSSAETKKIICEIIY